MRVSIFSERGILASLLQLIHVRATAGRWNVIIDRAMKYADRFVHDIKPPRKEAIARRIECDVSSKLLATRWSVHRQEPLLGGPMGSSTASREPHNQNPLRVNSRMLAE